MRVKYAITLGLIGVGFFSIANAETPSQYIHNAKRVAHRAANIESALTQLEANAYGIDISSDRDNARATVESTLLANRIALKSEFVFAEKTEKENDPKLLIEELTEVPTDAAGWKKIGLDFNKAKIQKGKYVQQLKNGWQVEYTIKPKTQKEIRKTITRAKARRGAVVLIEPKSGAVQAMVGINAKGKFDYKMATRADAPAASVFKIVTATALMEEGYSLGSTVCYHGGRSRLSKRNILGDKKKDFKCATITKALAFSINSIFAKLAYKSLSKNELEKVSNKYYYNQTIPFEFLVGKSQTNLPKNRLERARAAAGFRHTKLSPLHASLIGAAVANKGKMMKPFIVRKVRDKDGKVIFTTKPKLLKRVTTRSRADRLWKSMKETTKRGTARKYFRSRDFSGTASGKTGTLSDSKPYTEYSWFAGSAERKGKRIAVGALLCNSEVWHIKGGYAASNAMKSYFASR